MRPFILWFFASGVLPLILQGVESPVWIFEAEVEEVETALIPELRSGQVLSGSFRMVENEDGWLPGEGEITLDWNRLLVWESTQDEARMAKVEIGDKSEPSGRPSYYGLYFPLDRGRPELKTENGGILPDRFQLWLYPEARVEDPWAASPNETAFLTPVDYRRGWVRLSFRNAGGEPVLLGARLTYLSPWDPEAAPEEDWEPVARDLASSTRRLQENLLALKKRERELERQNESLRNLVDYFATEQSRLNRELERLEAALPENRGKLEAEKAALLADKAVLSRKLAERNADVTALEAEMTRLAKIVAAKKVREVTEPPAGERWEKGRLQPIETTVESEPLEWPGPEKEATSAPETPAMESSGADGERIEPVRVEVKKPERRSVPKFRPFGPRRR